MDKEQVMQIILKYSQEEQQEARLAIQSQALVAVLFDFSEWLRGQIKHVDREQQPTLEQVREKLYEFISNHGLNEFFE